MDKHRHRPVPHVVLPNKFRIDLCKCGYGRVLAGDGSVMLGWRPMTKKDLGIEMASALDAALASVESFSPDEKTTEADFEAIDAILENRIQRLTRARELIASGYSAGLSDEEVEERQKRVEHDMAIRFLEILNPVGVAQRTEGHGSNVDDAGSNPVADST